MKRVEIKEIILSFRQTRSVSKTARSLGIARSTVNRWVRRGKSLSQYTPTYTYKGLKRRSTRPKTIRCKLSILEKDEIVMIRERKHIGAKKIIYVVDTGASSRTIHRF